MPLITDLPYRAPGSVPSSERCMADLHLPEKPSADGIDCLVWVHGGGLTGGNKDLPNAAPPLLARGMALISPNYRLLAHAPFPACVEDIATVTAWARPALAERGIVCRRLFLGGISAGAYLAALIALDRRWLAVHGMDPSALAGVVPLSGQMTSHFAYCAAAGHPPHVPVIDAMAPMRHVRNDAPPMLMIAGSEDIPCRPEENLLMLAALRSSGHSRAECHIIPGRTHATIAGALDDPMDPVARLLHRFLGVG